MKKFKFISLICLIFIVFVFIACGSNNTASTPEQFVKNYLEAVQTEDYNAIWDMIPEKIQQEAIEEGIITDKQDGLDFIQFAVTDYYWLKELDLKNQKNYSYKINNVINEDDMGVSDDFKEEYRINDICLVEVTVTVDGQSETNCEFFLVKIGNTWYSTSVVGDDELFEY